MENIYLSKYAIQGYEIRQPPLPGTRIIVVIPCYNEPDALKPLAALYNGKRPACRTEVIMVVNHGKSAPAKAKEQNLRTVEEIEKWVDSHQKDRLRFHVIRAFDLPDRDAGVGLARKIGMDEAVRRFEAVHEKKGIIACFDADCTCSPDYLPEIHDFYAQNPDANAGLVYFEHDIEAIKDEHQRSAVINYELHLRYFKNALKYARFPYAYHTVGSCITVTSEAYQKQGGMNKRKAGEDFYFLQKIFPLGNVRNINTTTVFPSGRPSDRVPFGTGKAVTEMLKNGTEHYFTYNPKSFIDLKNLFNAVPEFWDEKRAQQVFPSLPQSVWQYLKTIHFESNLEKIRRNSTTAAQFEKAFYTWFNGFKALKYLHFARDHFYENTEILEAVRWLSNMTPHPLPDGAGKKNALNFMRATDRSDDGKEIFHTRGNG